MGGTSTKCLGPYYLWRNHQGFSIVLMHFGLMIFIDLYCLSDRAKLVANNCQVFKLKCKICYPFIGLLHKSLNWSKLFVFMCISFYLYRMDQYSNQRLQRSLNMQCKSAWMLCRIHKLPHLRHKLRQPEISRHGVYSVTFQDSLKVAFRETKQRSSNQR